MSGWVFGSENDPFWIKTNRGNKLKFQNPLHQMKATRRFQAWPESRSRGCIPSCISGQL
jgi:hypothetical protein